MTLDSFDIAILNHLRVDARISWAKLGEHISLSASATQRRVQSLEQAGIIRHFTIALDSAALGQEVRAFVQVKITRHDSQAATQFKQAVLTYPEVQACHKISGNTDFMLNVTAKDLPSFSQFLENKILYLPGVKDASSSIVLESIKEYGQPVRRTQ